MTARMISSLSTLLLQLNPYKSMGLDGIHPRILNELASVSAEPLRKIFEQPWEARMILTDWKLVNGALIFKEGHPRNYRPVSLLSVPGLEGILSKSADDTELGGAVDSLEGGEVLQRDLDKLAGWEITNHMKFNKGKCWILHMEQGNPGSTYRLWKEMLERGAMGT
ncbi:hypothetical protein WISP_50134 [Willisornis vidua]|uniref:Uncharacterized protein n=1 Tax=Willisornis vidua TaxID=1566151 RepID=A0ABQ9DJK8_9PASS|nr:hypothetical protein WISP_50134 [Willisornis vidua]